MLYKYYSLGKRYQMGSIASELELLVSLLSIIVFWTSFGLFSDIVNLTLEIWKKLSSIDKIYLVKQKMSMSIPNNLKVSILVDYAHEPESMRRLLETLADFRRRLLFDKVIHVVSCDGAGRDDWKKPILGLTSYSNADFSLITTDNYDKDDNPNTIVSLLSSEFVKETELLNLAKFDGSQKYYKEISRQKAFEAAIDIARKYAELSEEEVKVLIVTTGVGSEQLMITPDGEIERDEREELKKIWEEMVK
jgi:UDP-N-acetylmuramyl tripeptide synthase